VAASKNNFIGLFFKALKDSRVYGYQLQTWINFSKIRWQRDPLLICAKSKVWRDSHKPRNSDLHCSRMRERPTSNVSAWEQSRCSVSVERAVLVYIRSV